MWSRVTAQSLQLRGFSSFLEVIPTSLQSNCCSRLTQSLSRWETAPGFSCSS